MKPYFGKQVIERPRRGSSNPSLKMRHVGRFDEDGEYDGPTRIPMSMYGWSRFSHKLGEKNFTDVLGPVSRYLIGKIGCRWDDVYSELSKALGSSNYPMQHILYQHVLSGRFSSRPDSELDFSTQGGILYVDDAGIIRFEKYSWRNKYKRKDQPIRKIDIGNGNLFVEDKGIWYIGYFEQSTDTVVATRFVAKRNKWASDSYECEWPNYETGYRADKKYWKFVKIKQANSKELKQLKKLILGSLV